MTSYADHVPVFVSLAARLCRDSDEAQAVLRDTFEEAQTVEQPPNSDLRRWLAAIFGRRFVDRCRASRPDRDETLVGIAIPGMADCGFEAKIRALVDGAFVGAEGDPVRAHLSWCGGCAHVLTAHVIHGPR